MEVEDVSVRGRDSPDMEGKMRVDVGKVVSIITKQIGSVSERINRLTWDICDVRQNGSNEFIGLFEDMRLDELEQMQELVSRLNTVIAEEYADRLDGKGISVLKDLSVKEVDNVAKVE